MPKYAQKSEIHSQSQPEKLSLTFTSGVADLCKFVLGQFRKHIWKKNLEKKNQLHFYLSDKKDFVLSSKMKTNYK